MSNQPKKQSFLGGAAILASAVVIVKLIGAVYKIPLGNIIGDEGKAHFTVAYNIYNLLLTVSTAGLPLAISKLTSEAHALGRENEKRKLFRTAIWLFFALGLVLSLFMFFGAAQLAGFMNDSLAYWSIKALAPAVFCVCLLACMRGYTQGQGNMAPTAVSQVLEALCKLGIGLPLAWYVLKIGMSLDTGAAGAIFGVTIGTFISMLFLIGYLLTHREHTNSLDVPSGSGSLMKRILVIGIPITLSNSAMSIINILDTKIVLGQLQKRSHLRPIHAAQGGLDGVLPQLSAEAVHVKVLGHGGADDNGVIVIVFHHTGDGKNLVQLVFVVIGPVVVIGINEIYQRRQYGQHRQHQGQEAPEPLGGRKLTVHRADLRN